MWECKRCGAEAYRVLSDSQMMGGVIMEKRECMHCQQITHAAKQEHQGVVYEAASAAGARCPGCGHKPVRVYRSLPTEGGLKVRYHHCKHCGWRGKSVEKVTGR